MGVSAIERRGDGRAPMSAAIRPATRADLAALTALDARAYGTAGYGPYVFRQLFDLWPTALVVAEAEVGLVGYCAGALGSDGAAWILSLATDPGARRLGLGRALSLAAIDALWALGPRAIRLTVAPGNTAARALYAALGFTAVHLEADYYGAGQDRLVLTLRAPA